MENYKEKYEQALNRARVFNEKIKEGKGFTTTPNYTICETIFPELKESNDEQIKNEIIDYLKGFIPHHNDDLVAKSKLWIAWLEKQGELKPIFRVGDYIRNKKTKDRVLIEQIDIANKVYCYVSRDDAAEIHSDFRFSEQNDWEIIGQKIVGQKPTEWSEKDEKLLKLSLENLTELQKRFGAGYGKVGDCIIWLKSFNLKHKLTQL